MNGRAELSGTTNTEEFKSDERNAISMKQGDEDLVEDDMRLDDGNESLAEQKVTGSIPMLKNNKNALIRNTKPFSQRLKSGELKIDIRDPHAVAN